jgi:hypothetical protein
VTRDPPTRPPIQKQAKSPQIPESRIHPGCETLTISAGADAARRALRPRSKLAWFYSAPLAGFYSAADSHSHSFRICPGSCSIRLAETDVRGLIVFPPTCTLVTS